MNCSMTVGTEQDCLVQLRTEAVERLVRARDLEVLLRRINMVKIERSRTSLVPTPRATTTLVLDGSNLQLPATLCHR
jgi:hypothetical protein